MTIKCCNKTGFTFLICHLCVCNIPAVAALTSYKFSSMIVNFICIIYSMQSIFKYTHIKCIITCNLVYLVVSQIVSRWLHMHFISVPGLRYGWHRYTSSSLWITVSCFQCMPVFITSLQIICFHTSLALEVRHCRPSFLLNMLHKTHGLRLQDNIKWALHQ